MSYYFVLQAKRLNRFLLEFGITPYLAYPLFIILFFVMSFLIFIKAAGYAPWLYILTFSIILESISQQDRTLLLKSLFNRKAFYKIRLIENLVIAIPFLLFLLYQQNYLFAVGLFFIALSFVFIPYYRSFQLSIPTPYKRRPFEFTAGFRNKIIYLPFILLLIIKSIQVGNANLALFILAVIFFICLSFYGAVEDPYFAWIHNKPPEQFLFFKIKQGLINSTILSGPILLILGLAFFETWPAVLLIQGMGYVLIMTIILAKYSAFPSTMNLPQIILFMLCFWLPPMLLIAIPLFYRKAIKKLTPILT